MGKGGVGKSAVTEGAARHLCAQGKRVYLAKIDHGAKEQGALERVTLTITTPQETTLHKARPAANMGELWQQTLAPNDCFKEYIALKLKIGHLIGMFLNNKFIQYLQKASPGIKEIVLLGKVWYERNHYDVVIVDMPSTGHGLAMINAPFNFAKLFPGGPVYQDAKDMIVTLSDPAQCAVVCVSLAEEMPLQESTELQQATARMLPHNTPWLVLNKITELGPLLKAALGQSKDKLTTLAGKNPVAAACIHLEDRQKQQTSCIDGFDLQNFKAVAAIKDYGHLDSQFIPADAFASQVNSSPSMGAQS
jgi:hypothetical protein